MQSSGIHHTELTVETGRERSRQNDIDKKTKYVQENAKSFHSYQKFNVPGTATLEHAGTMVECTEPEIPYKYHWPAVPANLCC